MFYIVRLAIPFLKQMEREKLRESVNLSIHSIQCAVYMIH